MKGRFGLSFESVRGSPGLLVVAAALASSGTSLTSASASPLVSASGDVEVVAGYDDNMFLAVAPDGLGLLRLGGLYAAATPWFALDVASGETRLRASYLGDFRGTADVGRLDTHIGELRLGLPLTTGARLEVAVSGGAFDASAFPQDHYVFGGGDLGLRLWLGPLWTAAFKVSSEVRALAADSTGMNEKDWLFAPSARLAYQTRPWLEMAAATSALLISPLGAAAQMTTGRFRRVRGGIEATAAAPPFTVFVGAWAGPLSLGESSQTDVGSRFEVRYDLSHHWQLLAQAELVAPVSQGASNDYARRLFSLGVAARAAVAVNPGERREEAPPDAQDLPPRIDGQRVLLQLRAPEATSVYVIGSWDDWARPGRRLTRGRSGGRWQISLTLPAGAHRYHFLVDGHTRRPPAAQRYASDGFGSEDGVLDVGPDDDRPR